MRQAIANNKICGDGPFTRRCSEWMERRTVFIACLKARGVASAFHYVPLHSAPAGRKYGRFAGQDVYTTRESERLTRLPLYYGLIERDRAAVAEAVKGFFGR